MSTTGKVLTVLVTLVAIVWVILLSGVTELNKNGAKALQAVQDQIKTTEAQAENELTEAHKARDQAARQQEATGEDVAVLQTKQIELERQRSAALEGALRYKLLASRTQASEKAATVDNETRYAELVAEKKAGAEARAEVKKLQADNKKLMAELSKLRGDFRNTLRTNQERVKRLSR